MTEELICPYCRFSKTISREEIPSKSKRAVCPRCKRKFDFSFQDRTSDPDTSAQENRPAFAETVDESEKKQERTGRWNSPWEGRQDTSILEGIFSTLRAVLFSPAVLFRTLAFKGGI
jgi:hypothetical protein